MNARLHAWPDDRVVVGEAREIRAGRILDIAVHEGTRHADTAVFLCHGGGGNKNQWRNQWRALADAGYTVVAWDFIGHGRSPAPRGAANYRTSEFVRDYGAVFDRYRRRRNVLAGHSFGGAMTVHLLQSLQAAGRLAEVHGAAILAAPFPGVTGAWPLLRLPDFMLTLLKPLLARNFRRLAWDPGAPAELVAFEERVASRNPIHVFRALITQAQPFDVAALASLHLPVAVLAGASDALVPPDRARLLADALPDARFHVFGGCGHQIMLEKPEETTRLLLGLAAAEAP